MNPDVDSTLGRLYFELRAELDRLARERAEAPRLMCLSCGRKGRTADLIDHASDCFCRPLPLTPDTKRLIR